MSINSDTSTKDNNENEIIEKLKVTTLLTGYQNENNNYLKIVFSKSIKINILIIICFILFFISEFFFREPLFEYSKTFEGNWQNKTSNSTIIFFKIITKVGGEYMMAAPVAFVLLFFSLIKSSFYISGLIFLLHFHSLMKIWYGNKRPFWEVNSLYKGICDGGFGNPSGHSISSVYLYLTLFAYLNETKILKNKILIKIILFLFFSTLTILIILSRLILGIHSINQVIYGSILGMFVSLLIVQIFKFHQMPISFYKNFFKEKIKIFIISFILIGLVILSICSSLYFNSNFDYDYYDGILTKLCNLPKYRKFNYDGLFGAFVILSLLGMYFGQIIFWFLIDNYYKNNKSQEIESLIYSEEMDDSKEYLDENNNNKLDDIINNWNKNRYFIYCSTNKVLKLLIILIICCCPIILFIKVSKENNLAVIFIFKFGIPFFLSLFFLYSFGFYYIIKIFCGENYELLKRAKETIKNKYSII